jgi:hypothetical protein
MSVSAYARRATATAHSCALPDFEISMGKAISHHIQNKQCAISYPLWMQATEMKCPDLSYFTNFELFLG